MRRVKTPVPAPSSAIARALLQSTGDSIVLARKRELGVMLPTRVGAPIKRLRKRSFSVYSFSIASYPPNRIAVFRPRVSRREMGNAPDNYQQRRFIVKRTTAGYIGKGVTRCPCGEWFRRRRNANCGLGAVPPGHLDDARRRDGSWPVCSRTLASPVDLIPDSFPEL